MSARRRQTGGASLEEMFSAVRRVLSTRLAPAASTYAAAPVLLLALIPLFGNRLTAPADVPHGQLQQGRQEGQQSHRADRPPGTFWTPVRSAPRPHRLTVLW